MVQIITRYDYEKRFVPGVLCDPKSVDGRSRTIQSAKDECDINVIMERYEKTGCLVDPMSGAPAGMPMFGDFSDIGDYHAVLCRLQDVQMRFMLLPAGLRARFGNDPAELLRFVFDEKNVDEAVKLGLIVKTASSNGPGLAAGAAGSVPGGAPKAPVAGSPDGGSGGPA